MTVVYPFSEGDAIRPLEVQSDGMAIERLDVEDLTLLAGKRERARGVLLVSQPVDLPLVRLGVAQIAPEENFYSRVLIAVDGSTSRLVDDAWG